MAERNFRQLLEDQWSRGNFLSVGLDSEFGKIAESDYFGAFGIGPSKCETMIAFNGAIVEATRDLVSTYKINPAYYEAHGSGGMAALYRTISNIHFDAPDVLVILDAKRADTARANASYAEMAFDYLKADAITVHPYLGGEALRPFFDHQDKGVLVVCRTADPGADKVQDLPLQTESSVLPTDFYPCHQSRLYLQIANLARGSWNKNQNCGLVADFTQFNELRGIRLTCRQIPILIPDVGGQNFDLKKTMSAGLDHRGRGLIVNSSHGIIFASPGHDFAEAARRETQKLCDQIKRIMASP